MCSRIIPHLNRRKFLKLNKIKRTAVKSKRLKKKAVNKLRVTQPKVCVWEEPKLMSKLEKNSRKVSRKISTDIDDSYTQDIKHSLHEARERIESILLTRLHDLLSPSLSKNATRRLLKNTALEIAANFGVPRKKFKGTNKWLDTFLKHNELLGYSVSDNFVHADVKEKQRNVASTNAKLDDSVELDVLKPDEEIPDLDDLFTSKVYNVSQVEENTCKAKKQCKNALQSKSKADAQSSLYISSENNITEDEILSEKDSYQWIGPSVLPKRCLLERIGFTLRRFEDSSSDCNATFAAHKVCSVYDELFLVSQALNVSKVDKNPSSIMFSSDDSDSGYRSRSESKNDERQSGMCPIVSETTLNSDCQHASNLAKTSKELSTSVLEGRCNNSNTSNSSSLFHSVLDNTSDPLFFSNNHSTFVSDEKMDYSENQFDQWLNLFDDQDPPELQNVESVTIPANVYQNELDITDVVDFTTGLFEQTNVLNESVSTFNLENDDELIKALYS